MICHRRRTKKRIETAAAARRGYGLIVLACSLVVRPTHDPVGVAQALLFNTSAATLPHRLKTVAYDL